MSLVPYDSWLDIDKAFDQFFAPRRVTSSDQPAWLSPRVDIHEYDDHYEISAELPGLKKEDLDINLHEGILTIEARKTEETNEEKEGKVIRKERHSGHYLRRFNLGSEISDDAISASFSNGLLELKINKPAPEAPKPRKIDIA